MVNSALCTLTESVHVWPPEVTMLHNTCNLKLPQHRTFKETRTLFGLLKEGFKKIENLITKSRVTLHDMTFSPDAVSAVLLEVV